jgi:phosphoribosyl-ATP pyrophosphohydrolase/phosphoribosyl-AMP cyclohydrolase
MTELRPMPVKLNDQGLLPAIAQDINTGQVLMLGYVNPGSLKRTLEGGQVWFYSRSREDLWHKGEMSGHYLNLKEAWLDCDADTVLLRVQPDGPTCHTGAVSCFFNLLEGAPAQYDTADNGARILDELFALVKDRQQAMPQGSYTTRLFEEGVARIAQKVIEEAGETAIAAVQGDQEALPQEVADLLYHTLVLLAASGVGPAQVWEVLRRRRH